MCLVQAKSNLLVMMMTQAKAETCIDRDAECIDPNELNDDVDDDVSASTSELGDPCDELKV